CGLYIGLLLLFAYAGTFDLQMLAHHVEIGTVPLAAATAAGILILIGAAGKSAQVPLFIWLPDAMEGPTPVSALIHAATMVAAGVFLVARTYFIYVAAPAAMEVAAWTGLATAFLAATMALSANDIKRVLAFSTVSQLGYMMLGLGVGGYTSGLFHLTTHAFFKALLFLGAGSVIHAVHTNDMRRMGGLSKQMPATFVTMLVATLAIAGFPFLSGWYSKEAILHDVYAHSPLMWAIALATAGMTAFYMFRLVFLTFSGSSRDHHSWEHAHESPLVMTGPLFLLAFLSVVSGWALEHEDLFASLVHFELPHSGMEHHAPSWLGWAALGVFAGGLGLSYRLYGTNDFTLADEVKKRLSLVHALLEDRYGFDRFFLLLVRAADALAAGLYWFDAVVIDGLFVDGWAVVTRALAEVQNFFDNFFIDGAVDGVGTVTQDAGWGLSRMVRGQAQEYLLYAALAVCLFSTYIFTR
ncbi:MAG: NADH-quinone oxidoreductase subunit L, partial [Elusimicrobiota bacterium]